MLVAGHPAGSARCLRPGDPGRSARASATGNLPMRSQPPYPPQPIIAPKNGAFGLLLSFFIPGLGSMVNGSGARGGVILAVYVVGCLLSFFLIGIPIAIGAWIWGLVDGYLSLARSSDWHA